MIRPKPEFEHATEYQEASQQQKEQGSPLLFTCAMDEAVEESQEEMEKLLDITIYSLYMQIQVLLQTTSLSLLTLKTTWTKM